MYWSWENGYLLIGRDPYDDRRKFDLAFGLKTDAKAGEFRFRRRLLIWLPEWAWRGLAAARDCLTGKTAKGRRRAPRRPTDNLDQE